MADASDSKSDVGDYVWVQVPSPAIQKGKSEMAFPFVLQEMNNVETRFKSSSLT